MKLHIIILIVLFFFFTRGLVVILHELGHAIPAILLTKKEVTIYIGSYGDSKNGIHFKIGLLNIWLNYKAFSWKNGLCSPSDSKISINSSIIYVFFGPICATFFASIFLYLVFSIDFNDYFKLFSAMFFGIAIMDLFQNLTPNKTPIKLLSGKHIYNDGYALVKLLKYRKHQNEYLQAIEFYDTQEFEKATKIFDSLLNSGLQDDDIFRLHVSANIQIKKYERAKVLFDESEQKFILTSNDYCNGGMIYSKLNLHDEALILYGKSIELDTKNGFSLNNKAFTLNILERYEEAITIFDKAIEFEMNCSYALSNRGFSKIKLGRISEGLIDIENSIEMDENNAYAYRNLGIYHFELGEIEKANELFLKAKKLDDSTHLIDELILSTN
uniref:tetratricopeptide repeat protein n=1 Tax=Flavobacterium sp. TaxID=239 RepID=UPI00404AA528